MSDSSGAGRGSFQDLLVKQDAGQGGLQQSDPGGLSFESCEWVRHALPRSHAVEGDGQSHHLRSNTHILLFSPRFSSFTHVLHLYLHTYNIEKTCSFQVVFIFSLVLFAVCVILHFTEKRQTSLFIAVPVDNVSIHLVFFSGSYLYLVVAVFFQQFLFPIHVVGLGPKYAWARYTVSFFVKLTVCGVAGLGVSQWFLSNG